MALSFQSSRCSNRLLVPRLLAAPINEGSLLERAPPGSNWSAASPPVDDVPEQLTQFVLLARVEFVVRHTGNIGDRLRGDLVGGGVAVLPAVLPDRAAARVVGAVIAVSRKHRVGWWHVWVLAVIVAV